MVNEKVMYIIWQWKFEYSDSMYTFSCGEKKNVGYYVIFANFCDMLEAACSRVVNVVCHSF